MYSSTCSYTLLIALVVLALSASTADAFSTPQRPTAQRQHASVSLNLLPDQASDLVAASLAAYSARDESTPAVSNKQTATAARALAFRVFSLPSSLIKRHPHPKSEGLPASTTRSVASEKDYVLYPVIGFRYVRDSPGHCTALPTVSSVASCRLPSRNEPVYGWFHPL
jgi:hypothetical protein